MSLICKTSIERVWSTLSRLDLKSMLYLDDGKESLIPEYVSFIRILNLSWYMFCFHIPSILNYLLLKLSFSALRARIVSTGSLWPAWACTLDSVTLDKRAILETWNGFLHKIVYPHERIDQKLLCYGWGYCGLWRRGGAHLLAPRYFINDVLIRC